jgi:hypothetical protein
MHLRVECFAMRAFEISLNGKKLCVAGIGDNGVLSAIVNWTGKSGEGDSSIAVGGLVGSTGEHIRWIEPKPLQLNDELHIRIIDTDKADKPVERYRTKANTDVPKTRHIGGIIGPY